MAARGGVVRGVSIHRDLAGNVIDRFLAFREGDVIDDSRVGRVAGVIFLKYGSADEMIEKSARMNALVSAEIE